MTPYLFNASLFSYAYMHASRQSSYWRRREAIFCVSLGIPYLLSSVVEGQEKTSHSVSLPLGTYLLIAVSPSYSLASHLVSWVVVDHVSILVLYLSTCIPVT